MNLDLKGQYHTLLGRRLIKVLSYQHTWFKTYLGGGGKITQD